jgi:hypothetical protein
MDPIGFGLENYDMQGRYREHDDGLPECPIEGQGALPDGLGNFSGPAELAEILLDNGYIDACVMEQLYQFAVGPRGRRGRAAGGRCPHRRLHANGYDMRELLLSFVTNERFASARADGGVAMTSIEDVPARSRAGWSSGRRSST